ncbi:ACT domain-containing protein [Pisolithus croceorrhizus]|nr:ACT domain-containing protein [Pisolithus croceorrhizus]
MPPPANHPAFHLQVLQQAFDVQQYPCDCDISEVLERLRSPLNRAGLLSLTRTAEEVSIIQEACEGEGRWKCIKILGPMDFGLTGVICSLTAPLKEVKIPVFVVSTWNTDYVLISVGDVDNAVAVLSRDGWQFV